MSANVWKKNKVGVGERKLMMTPIRSSHPASLTLLLVAPADSEPAVAAKRVIRVKIVRQQQYTFDRLRDVSDALEFYHPP